MALNMKTFPSILNSMVTWIRSNNSTITDFFVGSSIRTLLESIAIEIESLYYQMYKGFQWAIQNSIFYSFDFLPIGATASTGVITITFNIALPQAISFPSGFLFATLPLSGVVVYFSVLTDTFVSAGATTVDLSVQCTETGVIGNVPAGSIRISVIPMPIVTSIYNNSAFDNGSIAETDAARKVRFTQYIKTLSKGTLASIKYGCMSVPGVSGVSIVDGMGLVTIYAHDAAGGLSLSLQSAIIANLVNYRSAGVEVQVLPVSILTEAFNVYITLNTGFDITSYISMIQSLVVSYLNAFTAGQSLILSTLNSYIVSIDPNAIYNVTTSLAGDVTVSQSQLIKAGTIAVTCTTVSS